MSQRLDITHPYLLDPSTDEPLRAIDIIRGKAIWPVLGGSGETETDDENEDDTETGTDDQETDDPETDDDSSSETETISRAEYDRLMSRMQAADRRASNFETKVKEYEKAGQSETEKLQSERDEAKAAAEGAAADLRQARISNAFLALPNGPSWHDPEDALTMLTSRYMDGVDIDDKGKVTGIAEAVKRMAKEKSYLVKTTQPPSSGDTMNGKRKGNQGNATAKAEELKKRFPHLARG